MTDKNSSKSSQSGNTSDQQDVNIGIYNWRRDKDSLSLRFGASSSDGGGSTSGGDSQHGRGLFIPIDDATATPDMLRKQVDSYLSSPQFQQQYGS